MKTNEKEQVRLTADEAEYIEGLIVRNACIVRSVVKAVLQEKYEYIGEDCISEIYYLACRKITVLKTHENPDAWITVASRKVALNMARKHNTQLNNTSNEEIKDIPIEDNVFEEVLYNIWSEGGTIDKLLRLLTPREKEIYNLLYEKGLPSKEAAKKMNISESTVRNINSDIKKKIKKAIKTNKF